MTTANTTAPSLKLLAEDKEHDNGVSKITTFRVVPSNVTIEPGFNVRTDDDTLAAHIDRLYLAMKAGAAVPAIDVRVDAGKIILVDGYCRTTAAQRLQKEVPEFTLEARQFRGNEQERVLHMLGTGSGQKALTPLEQGIGYLRLMKYGMTAQAIADKLGVSVVTVSNGLTLAEAPVEVQDLVRSGQVSSSVAREAVKQGAEGVEALKAAAATTEPHVTKEGKKSKKKKVTAKKLAGTAGAKGAKTKNKKSKAAPANATAPGACATEPSADGSKKLFDANGALAGVLGAGEILVMVNKTTAQAVMEFLRANAPDEAEDVKAFASNLEMALM